MLCASKTENETINRNRNKSKTQNKSNNFYNLVYMRISTYYLIKYIYYYLYNLTNNFNLLTNTKLRKFDTSKHYSIDDMNISIYVKFAFSIYIINVKQKDT